MVCLVSNCMGLNSVVSRFVDQQAFLNKELEDVMRQIKDKEDILTKAVENQKNVDELMKKHKVSFHALYPLQYSNPIFINILKQEMADLQQRIDAVLAEKARLEAELKKISVNNRYYQGFICSFVFLLSLSAILL